MAFDEFLADRIRKVFQSKNTPVKEKAMFGGLCFMLKDKMCVGVVKDELMARIDPEIYEDALTQKGCREMNFNGRPMKGYVFIDESGMSDSHALTKWLQLAIDFNPKAKASKKKSAS